MEEQIPPAPIRKAIVTSCEEDSSETEANLSDEDQGDEPLAHTQPDYLFDDQADEEDEAYVYKHLRSGVEENVTVVKKALNGDHVVDRKQVKVLKPRNSDAVLSCPCCFNIVCMDCQQHERYENQYRAMFVMGIAVRWDLKLRYDKTSNGLVAADETQFEDGDDDPIYYTVCCANCQTTVAALDMTDEVYHFSGCLASS